MYVLDRPASSLRFTLTSNGVQLAGDLEDVRAETAVVSGSPLRLKIAGKGDFRTIQVTSSEPFLAVAINSVLQNISNPIFSLEGYIEKALRSGDMVFDGTVKQGKKVRKVSFPLKLEGATKERIAFQGRADAPLSDIVDDLPFTLPDINGGSWSRGTAKAEGRFIFRRKR